MDDDCGKLNDQNSGKREDVSSVSKQSCNEMLQLYMKPDEYRTLMQLVAFYNHLPVEYDATTKRFEPALDQIDPETTKDGLVDVLFTACDILSERIADLDLTSVQTTTCCEPGNTDLVYDFADSEEPELIAFQSLLRPLQRDKSFGVDVHRKSDHIEVTITIHYLSDQDYQNKKDQIYFLRDLARRRAKDNPFQGQRL